MSKRRVKRAKLPTELGIADVTDLVHDGRGVAHINEKVVFIDNALPGDKVSFRYTNVKRSYDEGIVEEVLEPSPMRVEAKCPHFGVCGACSLQNMSAEDQMIFKEKGMLSNLQKMARVQPETILPPLHSVPWGYRRKARLGVRYVSKKGKALVGFREKNTNFLADLTECHILHPIIGKKLLALSELVTSLSFYDRLPQFEFSMGDTLAALIVRHMEPVTKDDLEKLKRFGADHGFQMYLQPKGPDTTHCIYPDKPEPLTYSLPDFDLTLQFLPHDFTQVNIDINQQMVKRAVELLDVQPDETVMDLFCGIGNFSLPLARKAKHVIAVEGDENLVQRARENAIRNDLHNVEFHATNLMEDFSHLEWASKKIDKLLIDPPRSGALEVAQYLKSFAPKRIVYVSCNPATLARDAEEIVHNQGYVLRSAGVMDMFPHTTHVESIAVFDKV